MGKAKTLINQNLKGAKGFQSIESDNTLLHRSDTSSLSEHNEQYTVLLKAYVEDYKLNSQNKRKNKEELFKIAKMLLFWVPLSTICLMFAILWCLVHGKVDILEALPELLAALVTLLGTFMMVPKMITKYLFNRREETHLAEIIGKIQTYDRNIRDTSSSDTVA